MSIFQTKDIKDTWNWKHVGNQRSIKIGHQIGEGNQSRIFRGVFNKRDVAVKSIFYDGTEEPDILRNLNHENIIRVYFTDFGETNLYIVMEYCQHTLREYVESSYKSNNLTPIKVLQQVTEGLYYLHNGQKVCTVHRDLKPTNILFHYVEREKIWKVKISDFGISKEFNGDKTSTMTRVRGTSGYTAPELLTSNQNFGRISKETDMFSLGVTFYYTLSGGRHPFSDDPNDVNAKVRDCEPCLDNLLPEYVGCSVESLILAMLEKDYHQRIPVSEVKCHHIFWTATEKLDFLQKTSNYMEDRNKHQQLIKQFEARLDNITGGNLWKDLICSHKPELKRVIEKRPGWEKKTSLQDLLRSIRNWSSHFFDKNTTSELQKELGGTREYPKGFIKFFESCFPKLIPTCYTLMKTFKDEDIFKLFYVIEKDYCDEESTAHSLSPAPDIDSTKEDRMDKDDIKPSLDEERIHAVEPTTSSTLVLRDYQKGLAKQALAGENSLIIAPTGSGKTAVANEIIKNHLMSRKSKLIIFLVSKTTLGRQQYDFFSGNLSEHLKDSDIVYLNDKNTTNTAVSAIFKSMKLIISTPQILINELKRLTSFISFGDISMMIFDECHNTTGNHPYKVLMDMMQDYKADHSKRNLFQVVGMTASPGAGKGKTRKKVLENLITLLARLDVKVCPAVVEKHTAELHQLQNKIKERMTKTKQESNIRAFRDGKCRILIATSVAEEELDIPACNLVIMYNYVTGEVGRIQRAGRGRAENSRSILITPLDSEQIQKEKINAACAIVTDQALKDLKELSHNERIERIEYIQRSQRRERLQIVQQNSHQLQEASNWKILFVWAI